MKRMIVGMMLIMAVMFTSLPLAVSAHVETISNDSANLVPAQISEPVGPIVAESVPSDWVNLAPAEIARSKGSVSEGFGNDTYYRDSRVILKGRVVYVSTVDLHIGGDPEVPGGDQSAPAADEVDTPLTQPITVVTRAHSGKFIIGVVNPVIHGVQIIVRRIKATGKIIEILNCGNWTRAFDSDYTFSCPLTKAECESRPFETSTSTDLSPDGLTKTVVVVTIKGCETKIEKTVTTTVEKRIEVCKPGSYFNVFEAGQANGKLGKEFKVNEAIVELPNDVQQEIIRVVGTKSKISWILVERDCDNKLSVRWFGKGGSNWSWLSFGVGVAVGFGLSFLIPHTRVINGIKTTVYPPVRSVIDGSGNPNGGVLHRP